MSTKHPILHAKGVSEPLCHADSTMLAPTLAEVTCIHCKNALPKIRWADPAAVKSAAEAWDDAIVKCRIYGHMWRDYTVTTGRGRRRILTVRQQCARDCKTFRVQDISADTGEALTRWATAYGDGYLIDFGRIDVNGRNVLRLAALRNSTISEIEDGDGAESA